MHTNMRDYRPAGDPSDPRDQLRRPLRGLPAADMGPEGLHMCDKASTSRPMGPQIAQPRGILVSRSTQNNHQSPGIQDSLAAKQQIFSRPTFYRSAAL